MSFPKPRGCGEGWQEQNHVCACAGCGVTTGSVTCVWSLGFGCECVWREQPGTEELPDAARNWPGVRETPGEASQLLQTE